MKDHSNLSDIPPTPPTSEEGRFNWLRLLRSRRVGVTTFWRMLDEHRTAEAALTALPDVARNAGVKNYQICPEGVVQAELSNARRHNARMICCGDPLYPVDLAQLADAPPFLWVIGDPQALQKPMIALVGARNASSLGQRMARNLAAGLAEAGYCVVSGLARGIDTAAHIAALDAGTVAVLAGGADVLYPAENANLAVDIVAKGGARVSEQPMGLQPIARHFPVRNRIISGLARAVVVVEAAARSGSLITARNALDQGREVMAVPGHPLDGRAAGCNILIRDGARLTRSVDDVIEALPPMPVSTTSQPTLDLQPPQEAQQPKRSLRDTAELHQQILNRLGPSPLAEDQLIRDLGAGTAQVTPVLTDLELEGRVQRHPGGLLSVLPK